MKSNSQAISYSFRIIISVYYQPFCLLKVEGNMMQRHRERVRFSNESTAPFPKGASRLVGNETAIPSHVIGWKSYYNKQLRKQASSTKRGSFWLFVIARDLQNHFMKSKWIIARRERRECHDGKSLSFLSLSLSLFFFFKPVNSTAWRFFLNNLIEPSMSKMQGIAMSWYWEQVKSCLL